MDAFGNFEYFKKHNSELYAKYGHSFVVVKDCAVVGVYDDFGKAYAETRNTEKLGTFIVQECVENLDDLIIQYQDNVAVTCGPQRKAV